MFGARLVHGKNVHQRFSTLLRSKHLHFKDLVIFGFRKFLHGGFLLLKVDDSKPVEDEDRVEKEIWMRTWGYIYGVVDKDWV